MKILRNEKGIALVMVLVLSAIALAMTAGMIYMVTVSTQMSGLQKRYRTAFEAGLGGIDVAYDFIATRGDTAKITAVNLDLAVLSPAITTPGACVTDGSTSVCTALGSFTGLATKLNLPTSCWSSCDSSLDIDPDTASTYDMRISLGTAPYNVYAKVVDTVLGNSAPDEGLIAGGVIFPNSGEITVSSIAYLHTIEIDSENSANADERAKLSILYQY